MKRLRHERSTRFILHPSFDVLSMHLTCKSALLAVEEKNQMISKPQLDEHIHRPNLKSVRLTNCPFSFEKVEETEAGGR